MNTTGTTPVKVVEAAYMVSSVLFILALSGLSHPESSRRGNFFGIIGMLLAIIATFFLPQFDNEFVRFFLPFFIAAIIGTILAMTVKMTQMPQMVALLHSFVGAAATLVSIAAYYQTQDKKQLKEPIPLSTLQSIETYVGLWVGAITFSGSVIAFIKFAGLCKGLCDGPMTCLGGFRHLLNLILMVAIVAFLVLFCIGHNQEVWLYLNCGISIFLGFHMILAIGAADMPVIVSMLNSYSGWATSASGFLLKNNLLIITGALVGSSGAILSYIMCRAMNRSFISVLLGGFGSPSTSGEKVDMSALKYKEVDLAGMQSFIKKAQNIIVVPGYGMAASGAHFVVGQLEVQLRKLNKKVRFCIHPVAGRLPGHMDILLSDARVPYTLMEQLQKMEDEFQRADLVIVIGANDIVNPIALDPSSPIGGMPVCEVWKAKQVVVLKRSMKNKGFAAIDNPLFYKENTAMFLGDAKSNVGRLVDVFQDGAAGGAPSTAVVEVEGPVEKKVNEDDASSLDQYPVIMTIGVLRETEENERRVAIAPSTVPRFRKLGFGVVVESGAGEQAGWSDAFYESKGARRASSAMQVAENCNILIKIREPSQEQLDLFSYPEYSISYLNPARNQELFQQILKKRNLIAIAMEAVPRITRAQKMDTLSSMANVAGYRAVVQAFNHFPRYSKGVSTAAGKIYPATVFVIGVGVAGLSAIGTAKGLGAIVRAYDTRKPAQEQAASLGAEVVTVDYVEEGGGVGGYAKEMSEGYKRAQAAMFRKELPQADIIITTALIPGKPAPKLVEAEVVHMMQPGSVIVDLAAENGGNCDLTVKGEVVFHTQSGVTIIGYYDLPSRMAQQSSELYSTNVYNLIEELCGAHVKKGRRVSNLDNTAANWQIDLYDEIVNEIVVSHKGVNRFVTYEEKLRRAQEAAKKQPQEESKEDGAKGQQQTQFKGKNEEEQEMLIPKSEQLHKQTGSSPVCCAYFGTLCVIILCTAAAMAVSWQTNLQFMMNMLAFVLAIFVGYKVIWNVTPALHTPLMSVTNAISGIIVVGSMLQLHGLISPWEGSAILALISCCLASINVVGGFMVTQRMLSMFVRL